MFAQNICITNRTKSIKSLYIGMLLSCSVAMIYTAQEQEGRRVESGIETRTHEEGRAVLERFKALEEKLDVQQKLALKIVKTSIDRELREHRNGQAGDLTESQTQEMIAAFKAKREREERSVREHYQREKEDRMQKFVAIYFPNMKYQDSLETLCVV